MPNFHPETTERDPAFHNDIHDDIHPESIHDDNHDNNYDNIYDNNHDNNNNGPGYIAQVDRKDVLMVFKIVTYDASVIVTGCHSVIPEGWKRLSATLRGGTSFHPR